MVVLKPERVLFNKRPTVSAWRQRRKCVLTILHAFSMMHCSAVNDALQLYIDSLHSELRKQTDLHWEGKLAE